MVVLGVGGCGLLDASDPTMINDDDLNTPGGAQLLRGDVLGRFALTLSNTVLYGGTVADEYQVRIPLDWGSDPGYGKLDQRNVNMFDGSTEAYLSQYTYSQLQNIRQLSTAASVKLKTAGVTAQAGEMLAVRGMAMARLAGDYCPGFPSSEMIDGVVRGSEPLTTDEAFERALADYDSALALAPDSDRVKNFAAIGRAGALLELGRFAEAAAAVASVPTSYKWQAPFDGSGGFVSSNNLYMASRPWIVADEDGGNGLDYKSSGDPRTQYVVVLSYTPLGGGTVQRAYPAKYTDTSAPIVVASGIEARLIEAEAAFHTGGDWLAILNGLRVTELDPDLPELTDPGNDDARVDMLFRERAFWLYATDHRLADMRRLIRLYGRGAETVFPTGPFSPVGAYGTQTSLHFDPASEVTMSPNVTGCTED